MTARKRKPGRPSAAPGEKRPHISCTVAPETQVALRAMVEARQRSLGQVIDELVRNAQKNLTQQIMY